MHLGWNGYSLEIIETVWPGRMDEYQLSTIINMLLLYRRNLIDKCALVRTHVVPKDKESVICSAIWSVHNHHLSAIKNNFTCNS